MSYQDGTQEIKAGRLLDVIRQAAERGEHSRCSELVRELVVTLDVEPSL